MLPLREAAEELRVAVLVLRDTVLVRLLVTVERDELPVMPRTVEVVVPRVLMPERTAPRSPRVAGTVVRLLPRALVPVRPLRVMVRVEAVAPRLEPPVIAYPRPPLNPR